MKKVQKAIVFTGMTNYNIVGILIGRDLHMVSGYSQYARAVLKLGFDDGTVLKFTYAEFCADDNSCGIDDYVRHILTDRMIETAKLMGAKRILLTGHNTCTGWRDDGRIVTGELFTDNLYAGELSVRNIFPEAQNYQKVVWIKVKHKIISLTHQA